ncbi:MAG: TVP38/TMEM64 family protein [Solirubrobacterales bacterium]|nr:TVP38/TMEM64 family protein [Solirubrobacterales bacterium]
MTRRAAILRLAVLAALMGGDRVDDAGPAAPFVFILVSALLTVLFVPGPILAASSGLLFGVALGTPVAIVSATLGAVLAFSISRWWGHDAVEHLAGPRLKAIRDWIGERGFRSVFYARLAPGAPYSLVNYASGLAPVRLRDFALATAIGCSPRAFAYTALGGSLDNLDSPEAMVALGVLVLMALVGIVPLAQERRRRLPRTKPSEPETDS